MPLVNKAEREPLSLALIFISIPEPDVRKFGNERERTGFRLYYWPGAGT